MPAGLLKERPRDFLLRLTLGCRLDIGRGGRRRGRDVRRDNMRFLLETGVLRYQCMVGLVDPKIWYRRPLWDVRF